MSNFSHNESMMFLLVDHRGLTLVGDFLWLDSTAFGSISHFDAVDRRATLQLEQISVLILNHIQSTVDRIGVSLVLKIGTGSTVPVIRVCSISSLSLACRYQCWWLLCMLNLINTR